MTTPITPTLTLPSEAVTGELSLTGTGQRGSTVEILVDGEVVGRTRVDSAGTWALTIEVAEPGQHQLSARMVDADDQVVAVSEPVSLSLTAAATQTEILISAAPAAGDTLAGDELTFGGTGEPGAQVEIVIDGEVVGSTQIGSAGTWEITIEAEQTGQATLSVQALYASGEAVTVLEPILVDLPGPDTDTGEASEALPVTGAVPIDFSWVFLAGGSGLLTAGLFLRWKKLTPRVGKSGS
jgi:hypothetical protein